MSPITWLTCYDYPTAYFQEQAGVDMILVGDSLGMTMLGYDSTLPVTMDDMIRHTQAVRRGSPNAFLIGDMPYMSYQPSVETAVRNAGRFMAEAACDGIKLEGGAEMADRVTAIVAAGIPAIGHLGLTPQSASALGGFRLQGKGALQAKKIIDGRHGVGRSGRFCHPAGTGPRPRLPDHHRTSRKLHHHEPRLWSPRPRPAPHLPRSLWPLTPNSRLRWPKCMVNAGEVILNGLRQYVAEVQTEAFPEPNNYFGMKDEEYDELIKLLEGEPF